MLSIMLFTQLFLSLSVLAYPLPLPNPISHLSTAPVGYQYKDKEHLGTYTFGYDIEDTVTDNIQYRNEERHANGTVSGSYGYLQPDGNIHMVEYVADEHGYRAKVRVLSRGQLKPIPVNDDTINYDLTTVNAKNNNLWRKSPGLYNYNQNYKPLHHPEAPKRPIGTITSSSSIPSFAPPTASSFVFEINGQQKSVAFGDENVPHPQGPITSSELLSSFLTINQQTQKLPAVAYLRK